MINSLFLLHSRRRHDRIIHNLFDVRKVTVIPTLGQEHSFLKHLFLNFLSISVLSHIPYSQFPCFIHPINFTVQIVALLFKNFCVSPILFFICFLIVICNINLPLSLFKMYNSVALSTPTVLYHHYPYLLEIFSSSQKFPYLLSSAPSPW